MTPHSPNTKRAADKAATRALILATARNMFEAEGYEATTMRKVAAAAGKSTGAIFASFEDKADLFAAVYGQPPLCPVQAVKLGLRAPERVVLAEAA